MTSKEALNELLYYATLDDSGFEPYMKEYANQIEKDLEVLEILKEHLKLTDDGVIEYWNISEAKTLSRHSILIESKDTGATIHIHLGEEYAKIKEILEND